MAMAENTAETPQRLIRELAPRGGDPIPVGTITALVGASNSGKTETLHDILRLAANFEPLGDERSRPTTVLRDVTLHGKLTIDRLTHGLRRLSGDDGTQVVQGFGPDVRTGHRCTVGPELKAILQRPVLGAQAVSSTAFGELMPTRALYLDADRRQQLVERTSPMPPDRIPESLIQALHDAPPHLHEQLADAFETVVPGMRLKLDDSARVELTLRVAAQFPAVSGDPFADQQAFDQLTPLDECCTSWQAVAGILLGVVLVPERIVLIDQPELQLHPQTTRRLGRWLADQASSSGCQLFLATNSCALLAGLIDGNSKTTVVRCIRNDGTPSLIPVPTDVSAGLARHPLLASQNALNCLFHKKVVVVPRGLDALVYEAIAARRPEQGAVRFVHAHGAPQLARVTGLLRQTGIPLTVVTGPEVFQDERRFSSLVEATTGNAPPRPWLATRERLAQHLEGKLDQRTLATNTQQLEEFLDQFHDQDDSADAALSREELKEAQLSWNLAELGTLSQLPPELRSWVEDLLEELKQQRVFLAPLGGAASWLRKALPAASQSPWLLEAIKALHKEECPADLRTFVWDLVDA